ncbi:MAG: redoxin domain-containing protein [Planctomycetia bacterium]|nr:redoxin domain-containing protein [Planctomycetia bacterium]MCC7314622.1 redoxin domain-containing protein [Planctomycetota bacterium]
MSQITSATARSSILPVVILSLFMVSMTASEANGSPDDRIHEKLKDAKLRDMKGKEVKLLDYHKGKVLVVAYTGLGCPISERYMPRLAELEKKYGPKKVKFVGINANPQDSLKAIAKEAKVRGVKFPMLQDKNHALTEQLDAKTSTEVFVIDKEGLIRYRGMIDDQYALGEKRDKPKVKYLQKAIDAALKGNDPRETRTAAPGCLITRTASKKKTKASKTKFTYASHVAKIIQNNCVSCHRPGQVGPFPLTSYEQVTGWAAMMDFVVRDGRMPPWNADDEFDGHFANERKLSKKEKSTLLAWLDGGMPRGNPKKEPKPKKFPKQWRIGKPDKIYQMKESFLVPKEGTVEYKYFEIPTDFKEDKWIVAMEAHPGAAEVVHHVLAFIVDPKNGNRQPSQLGLEDGFLCATVPGDTPSIFPEGCAKKLPAGAKLIFQMHYTTNGKAQRDRSSIGLKFAKDPIDREVSTRGIYNLGFEIPAGAADYEVRSEFVPNEDIEVLSFFPHMHTRGKSWKFLIHQLDGTQKTVLSVTDYDFNWQESYILKQPMLVQKGTKIECIGVFDNSEKNYDNPDPTKPVKWGEQTWEEMMIGYIDWVPAKKDTAAAAAKAGKDDKSGAS